MNYENMWNELKEKIEVEKDNAWAKGFVVDYEMFLYFSETVRGIEKRTEQLENEDE